MQLHTKFTDFVWNYVVAVKSIIPVKRQHDFLMIDEYERWQMYGLQAIGRVDTKRLVWNEFAEVARVLKCGGWATCCGCHWIGV
jgi:hypothetical protein